MGYREVFLEHGIPYDDIDKELIDLLEILNIELELKTEFCCFGHDLEEGLKVGFSESVQDEDIMRMVHYLEDKIDIDFKKWVRSADRIWINWYFEDPGDRFDNIEEFNQYKLKYIENLIEHLKNYSLEVVWKV
ncbi:MAG: hypothetical protein JJT76_13430 [Clostridiaceae bacterium]|nr:hypothetical protein [Clostridiaceae bacterium]